MATPTFWGSAFLVSTTTFGTQWGASVASLADGRFVVIWTDTSATGGDLSLSAIRSQLVDPREAAVRLTGTGAADDLVGTDFADQIHGAGDGDSLAGAGGKDRLFGEAGRDLPRGGDGADRLSGGTGLDRLVGGRGADVFVLFNAAQAGLGPARDRISNLVSGSDRINLAAFMAGGRFIATATLQTAGDCALTRPISSSRAMATKVLPISRSDWTAPPLMPVT